MTRQPLPLVGYRFAQDSTLGPISGQMYEYVVGAGGLYLRARRRGLSVTMPIAGCEVRGLAAVRPVLELDCPKVPAALLAEILRQSRAAAASSPPLERLFYLAWEGGGWSLEVPPQRQTEREVEPLDTGPGSAYERALIEVHSHHRWEARFSPKDDRDESGFRLYAVLGRINERPEVKVRVGAFGYRQEIPAELVLEMPDGITDRVKAGREYA